MSLSSATSRVSYTGNGAVDTYSYTFKIFDQDDLLVVVRDTDDVETTLTIATDYTVTGVGETSGGNVVLVNSAQAWLDGDGDLKTGYVLTIRRVTSLVQNTDIRNAGDFYPETHEDTFDKLVMIDQQQQDEINRSVKLPETVTSASFDPTLPPDIGTTPNKVLMTNDDGDGFALEADSPTSTDISAASANAAAAAASAAAALVAQEAAELAETNAETAEANAAASAALLASAWSTGDVKLTLKAVADTGWIFCDDGTIGSAGSGATTRANADTEDLFTLLWSNVSDTYAAVSGGRGASAAADFAANKTIGLTKMLGRALAVSGAGATLTSRALGQTVGAETHTLISAEMPSHTHVQDAHTHTQNSHNHTQDPHSHVIPIKHNVAATNDTYISGSNNTAFDSTASSNSTTATNQAATATNQNATATNQNTGGDGSHNNMQPTSFLNAMIKL